jgi:hypothetical protein
MSHRLLFTIACILLLVPTLATPDEPARPTAERVKLVRQMYAKLPCDILELAEPARIVAAQSDGRALTLLLADANDKKLTIHLLKGPGELADSLLLAAGRLPARGPEESAVYGLLLRLSAKPPEKTPRMQLELIDAILAVLDQRIAGAMPVAASKAEK